MLITTDRFIYPRIRITLGVTLGITLGLLFGIAFPVHATDGVAEINHTCAVQTGCFPGDTAGYPVRIDGQAGGSYRLTGNLIIPDTSTDGIVIAAGDIGIDLNNFAIIAAACLGSTSNCTPTSGIGSGIVASLSLHRGNSVKNGSVTGMGRDGVLLGQQAKVTTLRVRWNRRHGIATNNASIVSGSIAYENGGDGIFVRDGSTVSGNTVHLNGGHGINGQFSSGSTLSENTAQLNGGNGIRVGAGSTVSGNTVFFNGGSGIETSSGGTVQGNTVQSNSGFGLNLDSQTGYRANVISFNSSGTVLGGVNLLGNACNGSTTCP